jgi:hypothetical protein
MQNLIHSFLSFSKVAKAPRNPSYEYSHTPELLIETSQRDQSLLSPPPTPWQADKLPQQQQPPEVVETPKTGSDEAHWRLAHHKLLDSVLLYLGQKMN